MLQPPSYIGKGGAIYNCVNATINMYNTSDDYGFITGGVYTLADAVKDTSEQKVYSLNDNSDISGADDLTLGGKSLSVTTDGKTITGGDKAISVSNGKILSINGGTSNATISGFTTDAISNAAGGTVNLTNVTISSAGSDLNSINNNGTINLDGTNTIKSVNGQGTMNISGGTTNLNDAVSQSNINIANGATFNNSGVVNSSLNNSGNISCIGTLNLNGGSSNSGVITQTEITNEVNSTVINSGNITITSKVTNNGIWNTTAASVNSAVLGVYLGNKSTLNLNDGSIDTIILCRKCFK